MTIRIGINGFGRMGRLALRAAWTWPDFEFVHINETKGGPEAAAHLLTFDSVHGRWEHPVTSEDKAITIDGKRLTFLRNRPQATYRGRTSASTSSSNAPASSGRRKPSSRISTKACVR